MGKLLLIFKRVNNIYYVCFIEEIFKYYNFQDKIFELDKVIV